jgi:hypothetical protein
VHGEIAKARGVQREVKQAQLDPTLTPARYMQWLIPDKIIVYRISAERACM